MAREEGVRFQSLQMIDRCLGVPLCGLFSLCAGRRLSPAPEDVERILVVKMLGVGSVIVMSPMFRSLRRRFPRARIDFLTMDNQAPIGRLYGLADDVYSVDFSSAGRFVRSNLATLRRLRRNRYDLVVDAEFYSRYTALLSHLTGARAISGFHSRDIYRGRLREVNAYFNQYRHMAANFLELALQVGAPAEDLAFTAPRLDRRLLAEVAAVLVRSGLDPEKPYILLNPHASAASSAIDRRWPLDYFRAVGVWLASRGYQVAVLDAPGQTAAADRLAAGSGAAVRRLQEAFGLDRLLALLKGAFLLITNDSGPLHMAVSLSTPTFSFFGTESPILYGYASPLHTVFCLRLACSPCLSVLNFKRGKCELGLRCMTGIRPEQVIAAFREREDALRAHWARRRDEVS
jgi:heptosyltransferase-2